MCKFAKGLFIFTGGVIVGGVYVTGKIFRTKEVAEAMLRKYADKIDKFVYGDYDPKRGVEPEEVWFTHLDLAENVLKGMRDLLNEYGVVTVAEYLELCELPVNHTDHNYGWTSLENTWIEVHPHSYVIKFPRAYKIK